MKGAFPTGGDAGGKSLHFGRMHSGLMDEIALYNRALSQEEIQEICKEQNHGEPLNLPTPSTGWYP